MERLMQYVWQHRLWPVKDMFTVDGHRVHVIDPGCLNHDSGPDFFNAKIRIGDEMWVGDVEIHVRASDWHRHGHDGDKAYDSVILHVVSKDDAPVRRSDGNVIPQMKMSCSPSFNESYRRLVASAADDLPCHEEFKTIDNVRLYSWLDNLAYERLYNKSERINRYLSRFSGDWESTCYVTLARALGFGVNSEPFERLALSVPLRFVGKHSDSALNIEALLFGQSGLLDEVGDGDSYVELLKKEYDYLARKFSLERQPRLGWKMSRMRPANFPHRRIAFLAAMLFGGFRLMSRIVDAGNLAQAYKLFEVELVGYWASHYTFNGSLEAARSVALSRGSITVLIINVVVPLLYAYGLSLDDKSMTDRAVAMLQEMKPESNSVVAMFVGAGVKCDDAFTSQALIQLRREYCEARKCLYCRVGHRMLSRSVKA